MDLPADCPAGTVDAPLLADATEVVTLPGLVSYVTASTPAEAAAFYQQELPGLGWQATADAIVSDTATVQDFTREGEQLSLIITAGDGGTIVRLASVPAEL